MSEQQAELLLSDGNWSGSAHMVSEVKNTMKRATETSEYNYYINYDILYRVKNPNESTYGIGQKFSLGERAKYVLAYTEYYKVNLINMHSGTRWTEAVTVEDVASITKQELSELMSDNEFKNKFKLIEE